MIPRMSSKVIHPITGQEFASMMKQVWPPSGWSSSVAVANSGGPDSTCLLFLLHQYFHNLNSAPECAPHVVSVTIDHDLQKGSTYMADVAEKSARILGIRHITSRIPWGDTGFPSRPGPNDTIEEKAREARYMLLYKCMKDMDANTVAFGHHADDQVETMLMRLGRGSSVLGLAGMSMLSRRGMGNRDEEEANIRWSGYEYQNTWKIRPLLRISKDRILATCEENGLDYVTDPTNFQPALTIRNAIRDAINRGFALDTGPKSSSIGRYPPHLAEQLNSINAHGEKHSSLNLYLHAGKENLYRALEVITNRRAECDREVDRILEENRRRSPPGTIMLPYNVFRDIPDEMVQQAVIWRIMKYVSPSPWGSLRAEGHRRTESAQRLLNVLCDDKAHERHVPASLSVGSRVWWRLVHMKPHGYSINVKSCPQENLAWLACRSPQSRQASHDPLNVDITPELCSAYREWIENHGSPIVRFVYDCRFLLTFDVSQMSANAFVPSAKVLVVPRTVWYLPQVVLQVDGSEDRSTIHDHIEDDRHSWSREWNPKKKRQKLIKAPWITTKYFRSITAV